MVCVTSLQLQARNQERTTDELQGREERARNAAALLLYPSSFPTPFPLPSPPSPLPPCKNFSIRVREKSLWEHGVAVLRGGSYEESFAGPELALRRPCFAQLTDDRGAVSAPVLLLQVRAEGHPALHEEDGGHLDVGGWCRQPREQYLRLPRPLTPTPIYSSGSVGFYFLCIFLFYRLFLHLQSLPSTRGIEMGAGASSIPQPFGGNAVPGAAAAQSGVPRGEEGVGRGEVGKVICK